MKKYLPVIKDALIMVTVSSLLAAFCNMFFMKLKGAGAKSDPLVTAINQGNLDRVKEILSDKGFAKDNYGFNNLKDYLKGRANKTDEFGRTPLMWAGYANYLEEKTTEETDGKRGELINALFEAGADVNIRDNDGWTPLTWASWSGMPKTADLFIAHGANVSAADRQGQTPLMIAALRGNEKMVRLLLAKGADKNIVSKTGQKALDYAVLCATQYTEKAKTQEVIKSML